MTPPILLWHIKAGKACAEHVFSDPDIVGPVLAEEIESHDPHAAQHAETLRLLSEVLNEIELTDPTGLAVLARIQLVNEIQAHLRTLRGEKGTP